MKVKKLTANEKIQVDDLIQMDHWTGKKWDKVIRVNLRFALVKQLDGEVKFRRFVASDGFAKLSGNTDLWTQSVYTVWRSIERKEC